MSTSSNSRWRTVVVVVGMLLIAGLSGYTYLTRFPNAFDREQLDPQEAARLQEASLSTPAAAATAGWPQWRGPNRDGVAPSGPFFADWDKTPPRQLWSVPCRGGYSSLSVTGGKIYTMDYDGTAEGILCLDAANGVPQWEYRYPADYSGMKLGYAAGPRATPTIFDGRLYTLGASGLFLCLEFPADKSAPKEIWRHDLLAEFAATLPSWGMASSPLIDGDNVIVQAGGKSGSVVAFDRRTGEKRWAAGDAPNGYSSPIVATFHGIRTIVAVTGTSVLGLRADGGEVLWQHPWLTPNNGNCATPVVVGEYVFVSSSYSKGAVLLHVEPQGQGLAAKTVYFKPNKLMRNHHSTSVHRDGFVYGFDNDRLKCIDLRQGKDVWDAEGLSKGSVVLVGDKLLGLTERGTLFLADAKPDGFQLLGKLDNLLSGGECWAAPTVVDGRIYLRDGKTILCLDARPPMN